MRKGWFKTYQNSLTKNLRKINKLIEDDTLWRGRFYVIQRSAQFFRYEDGSGGEMIVHLRFYDKKTGYYKDEQMTYIYDFPTTFGKLVWQFNDFIVNDAAVWKYDDPYKDTTDYRTVPYVKNDRREDNYFLDYEDFVEKNKEVNYEL